MRFYRLKSHCMKMRYSIEPIDRTYVKGYGFLSFSKSMDKNLSNKYGQKLLDSVKKSTTDAVKTTSKKTIQKAAEETGDLVGNEMADKITTVSKPSAKHSMELHSKNDDANNEIEATRRRYISPEERQQIIDELRLA